MKNWIAIAAASGIDLPPADRDRIVKPLDALEQVFRPLADSLTFADEPVLLLDPREDASDDPRNRGRLALGRGLFRRADHRGVGTYPAARSETEFVSCGDRRFGARPGARKPIRPRERTRLRPLHGIPIALKDLFLTTRRPDHGRSKIYEHFVPDIDAAVVEKLAAAGAVMMGKLNMHELAYGITSANPHFGPVRNPWNTAHIPGGSSGGSGAAVAAGLVFAAMGSDTGGSIRIPGVFLRDGRAEADLWPRQPLRRVPARVQPRPHGAADPLGARRRDRAERDRGLRPARSEASRGIRSGLRAGGGLLDPRACGSACRKTSFSIGSTPAWSPPFAAPLRQARIAGRRVGADTVPDIAALNAVARVILLAEASAVLEPHLNKRDQFGADVLALFDQGRLIPATDYINAQRLRRKMQREFAALWSDVDCFVTPATPSPGAADRRHHCAAGRAG